MDFNLSGKVAIVTGGGSGLGLAISEVLAAEGCNVVINYRSNPEQKRVFAAEIQRKYGTRCTAIYGDLAKTEDLHQLFEQTVAELGQVDILVNNAGVWPTSYVKDMPEDQWDETIRINLTGPFILSKLVVNHLLARKSRGKIINIVSQAAFHGSTSGHAHYAAAKAGLVSFTISLAREVARSGINVTAVAPGLVRTPMSADALSKNEARYLERIPLGRVAEPEEVAYAVAFLASDKSDYITGATIDLTGGMLMR
jgi:3-oxoacyl-[acyl-carrier protein] reductase